MSYMKLRHASTSPSTSPDHYSMGSLFQRDTGNLKTLLFLFQQVRLNSVPPGSVESLRRTYKSGLCRLIQDYRAYLTSNIKETGPRKLRARTAGRPRKTTTFSITNTTCSGNQLFNDSLVSPGFDLYQLNQILL